jgi:hypothetical protein
MAFMSILNQHIGPLPIATSFTAPSDGPSCFVLSGSVWSSTANQLIGVTLTVDGVKVGSASIWSNGVSTHRAVVPSYIPVTLKIGPHKLELVAENGSTISDLNDRFDLGLFY